MRRITHIKNAIYLYRYRPVIGLQLAVHVSAINTDNNYGWNKGGRGLPDVPPPITLPKFSSEDCSRVFGQTECDQMQHLRAHQKCSETCRKLYDIL